MMKLTAIILLLVFFLAPVYSQTGYRDPFEPLIKEEEEGTSRDASEKAIIEEPKELPADMAVEGILWGTDKPLTIINGEVYKVGDVIKDVGAEILKIEGNSVYIGYGEKIYKLKVEKKQGGRL